jgi:hypothetical protein
MAHTVGVRSKIGSMEGRIVCSAQGRWQLLIAMRSMMSKGVRKRMRIGGGSCLIRRRRRA